MNGDAGVLVWVLAVLRGDGVLLQVHRLAGVDAAVLQHHGGVAEDEVHRPVDVALPEELPLGVHVEGVLVADHVAPVDHRVVRPHPQRHRLVLPRARPVLEGDVPRDEPRPRRRCNGDRVCLRQRKESAAMAERWARASSPKVAVWKVVKLSKTLRAPAMMVFPFPSPTNIRFVFFRPTLMFSSYLRATTSEGRNED